MKQYDNDINNNNNPEGRKTTMKPKIYWRFITTIALPSVLLVLTLIAAAPTDPVQATVDSNETAATTAPGGASVGPADGGTNVTQSDCLPQNATTTTNQSSAVNAGGTNDTTATVAPSGASIGANDTSTSIATAGNTTTTGRPAVDAGATTTTNNTTTATVAPSGASIC
jgi:hypothetical protein